MTDVHLCRNFSLTPTIPSSLRVAHESTDRKGSLVPAARKEPRLTKATEGLARGRPALSPTQPPHYDQRAVSGYSTSTLLKQALHKHVFASIKQAHTKRQHLGPDYLSMALRRRSVAAPKEGERARYRYMCAQGKECYTPCAYGLVIKG